MARRILAPVGAPVISGLTAWTTHTPVSPNASTATLAKRGSGLGGDASWYQPGLKALAPSSLRTAAPIGTPNASLPSDGGAAKAAGSNRPANASASSRRRAIWIRSPMGLTWQAAATAGSPAPSSVWSKGAVQGRSALGRGGLQLLGADLFGELEAGRHALEGGLGRPGFGEGVRVGDAVGDGHGLAVRAHGVGRGQRQLLRMRDAAVVQRRDIAEAHGVDDELGAVPLGDVVAQVHGVGVRRVGQLLVEVSAPGQTVLRHEIHGVGLLHELERLVDRLQPRQETIN